MACFLVFLIFILCTVLFSLCGQEIIWVLVFQLGFTCFICFYFSDVSFVMVKEWKFSFIHFILLSEFNNSFLHIQFSWLLPCHVAFEKHARIMWCKVTNWVVTFIFERQNSLNNGMRTGVIFSCSSPRVRLALCARLSFASVYLEYAKKLHSLCSLQNVRLLNS